VFCLNSTVCFDSYVTYVFASLLLGSKLVVPGPTAQSADRFYLMPYPADSSAQTASWLLQCCCCSSRTIASAVTGTVYAPVLLPPPPLFVCRL
jgi:hypothetical protein